MLVPVPWLVLGVAVLLTFAACWGFVAFFQAPHSRAAFPTAVAVLGLALCLWCLLLIPIDIVNINHQGNWGDYHLNTQVPPAAPCGLLVPWPAHHHPVASEISFFFLKWRMLP